jgi:hypothetical protein
VNQNIQTLSDLGIELLRARVILSNVRTRIFRDDSSFYEGPTRLNELFAEILGAHGVMDRGNRDCVRTLRQRGECNDQVHQDDCRSRGWHRARHECRSAPFISRSVAAELIC